MPSAHRIAAARDELLARLAALDRLAADSAEQTRPVDLDPQIQGRVSRVDALQQQAMAQARAGRRHAETRRLRAALARIDAGDWGYCVRCDEEIEPGRLDHDAAIPTCLACAKAG